MLQLNFKQMLSLFLAGLMVHPFPMQAASSAPVLGSMNAYGPVMVGETAAPSEATLFAGDLVDTKSGNAVIQYKQGARVLLAKSSSALFSTGSVELKKGEMTFRSAGNKDVVFQATSLRLEPTSEKTLANVMVNDGKATISVKEGGVRAVDPSGITLGEIPAGKTQLFAMAVAPSARAAAAPAAASAAAPPIPSAGAAIWVALAVAGATIGTFVTAKVADNDDEVEARAAASPIRP
jgi:hypothetical protein